jgi:hypothetical protein
MPEQIVRCPYCMLADQGANVAAADLVCLRAVWPHSNSR